MKNYKLLNPITVVSIIFLFQFTIWLFFMPVHPNIPIVSGRFINTESIFKFSIMLFLFLIGIKVGTSIQINYDRKVKLNTLSNTNEHYIYKMGKVFFVIFLIGELVYLRPLLLEPLIIIEAIKTGWFSLIGEVVSQNTIEGLSTLNNLLFLSVATFSLLIFHPNVKKTFKKSSLRYLCILGIFVIIHTLVLSARMYFVYFILMLTASYLLYKKINYKKLCMVLFSVIFLIWIGETLRSGLYYSNLYGTELFRIDTQEHVLNVILQGYLAADFNNSQLIFNCMPSYQFISDSFLSDLFTKLGVNFETDKICRGINENYGTSNIFARLWFEAGWFSILILVSLGVLIGFIYKWGVNSKYHLSLGTILYVIIFPGLISITRINYFSQAVFVLPVMGLFIFYFLTQVKYNKYYGA